MTRPSSREAYPAGGASRRCLLGAGFVAGFATDCRWTGATLAP